MVPVHMVHRSHQMHPCIWFSWRKLQPGKPLYVAAIGAITNIATAILQYPDIINRIVLVWLAGNDFDDSPNVYNIYQDVKSAQVVFDSGVPFIHVPCNYVTSHLLTGIPELENCIGRKMHYVITW